MDKSENTAKDTGIRGAVLSRMQCCYMSQHGSANFVTELDCPWNLTYRRCMFKLTNRALKTNCFDESISGMYTRVNNFGHLLLPPHVIGLNSINLLGSREAHVYPHSAFFRVPGRPLLVD